MKTKIYKFGDKVVANGKKRIVTLVKEIMNYSDDKYYDYSYHVSFEDNTYLELSYEDLEKGWKKQ